MELMRPDPETRVVDVGVADAGFGRTGECATYNFFEELYPWRSNVTAVGLGGGARFAESYPDVRYVEADGCSLPFDDGEFDVYFSNAVVEHVGGRERQRLFVAEALRVAGSVFLTTPNRWFPIELHTRIPLVHWLPASAAGHFYELVRRPWAKEIDLLGPKELAALFPPGSGVRIVNSFLTLAAVVGGAKHS